LKILLFVLSTGIRSQAIPQKRQQLKTKTAGKRFPAVSIVVCLLADPQLQDQGLISLRGSSLEVIQQLTPLGHKVQKATA
jgi:hypothetical protein